MYAYLIYQLCIKVPQKSSSVLGIQLSKEKLMVGLAFSSKTPWSVSEALRASSDYNKPQRHHQRVGRSCKTRWGPWLKRPTRRCWRCRGLSEGPALCFNLLVSGLSDRHRLIGFEMASLQKSLLQYVFPHFMPVTFHFCVIPAVRLTSFLFGGRNLASCQGWYASIFWWHHDYTVILYIHLYPCDMPALFYNSQICWFWRISLQRLIRA